MKFDQVEHPGHPNYRFTAYSSRIQWVAIAIATSAFASFSSIFALSCLLVFAVGQGGSAVLVLLIISAFAAVLGFGGLTYSVARMIKRKPTIILDNTGIHDNGSIAGFGFINWNNIRDLDLRTFGIKRRRMLSIHLTDAEAVLNQASSVKGKAMRANITLIGTPVAIVHGLIAIPLEQLEAEIRQNLNVRAPLRARPRT